MSLQDMGIQGEKNKLEMAGATGAIEDDFRQGLTAHAARHNKVHSSKESRIFSMFVNGARYSNEEMPR